MKVFITNLPSSEQRKLSILNQIKNTGVDYEFVDCVVGKNLSDEQIEQVCDIDRIRELNKENQWVNKGMIGCTLTSRQIHTQIVERNLDYAMLLEDDAILPKNLKKLLDDTEKVIKQGDIVLFYWLSWQELVLRKETEIKTDLCSLYEPLSYDTLGGGTATVFSRKAAEKIAQYNTPIKATPDSWGEFLENGCIDRILIAHPRLFDTGDFQSTMELGNLVQFRKIINNVFPFSYLLKRKRNRFKRSYQNAIIR